MEQEQKSTEKKLPQVAIVGRPNVGKSTLFNALSRTRLAIVADVEGVTRDRRIMSVHPVELEKREILLMDTGGWIPLSWRKARADAEILRGIETQILAGLKESAVVLLVVDVRAGRTVLDEEIASFLRRQGHDFYVVCNKVDSDSQDGLEEDFKRLGGKGLILVSAEHRRGLSSIWEVVGENLPEEEVIAREEIPQEEFVKNAPLTKSDDRAYRVCIVGRPNVGKSSFLNAILGEERVVESPIPGTTTDPVDIEIERAGKKFIVIDTAGIRRHSKRADDVENLSVMYAKRNLEKVDLAFLVLDAADGITAQDAKIASLVHEAGCAAVVIANKWDLAPEALRSAGKEALGEFVESAKKEVPFLDYAPVLAISAKESRVYSAIPGADATEARKMKIASDLIGMWSLVRDLITARDMQVPTVDLNELVDRAMLGGPNIAQNVGKVHFAHRVPVRTPVFCAYVQNPKKIPDAYRRYLSRALREAYGFRGNPIRWIFRAKKEIKAHSDSAREYKLYRATMDAKS